MNRRIALLVAVVALVGLAGIAAAGPVGSVVAQDDADTADGDTESDGVESTNETTDISPGERLSGVIGVQNAEVSGEVESRAFEVGLDRATTDEERADVVVDRLDRSEQRLVDIEERQQELRERRDAGELSEGAFAARMAETSARAEQVKRGANRSTDVARGLPEEVRAERGLDEERLNELRDRAGNASGPEIAAIARGVAGNDVGGPLAQHRRGAPNGTPGGSGGPGDGGPPGEGTDTSGEAPENVSDGDDATAVGTNTSGSLGGNDTSVGAGASERSGVDDASENTGGDTTERTGGEDASERSTATERGENASDSDRRSVSGAVASLPDAAIERATAGWSAAGETASAVDSRLRDGTMDLGSLASLGR